MLENWKLSTQNMALGRPVPRASLLVVSEGRFLGWADNLVTAAVTHFTIVQILNSWIIMVFMEKYGFNKIAACQACVSRAHISGPVERPRYWSVNL